MKEPRSLDEFADWTDEVESRDEQISERAIIGQLVRFTNEGQWVLPEQDPTHQAADRRQVRRTLTKWGKDKRPVETIFLKAGEKIPDLEKLNEETPKSEWIEGFDGNPERSVASATRRLHGRSDQHRPILLAHSTTGGGIAVRELIDRINWMRRFRGNAVYPIVQLSTRFMKTKCGTRLACARISRS